MTIISPDNVIAVQTAMSFDHTLESLRAELTRHEFRILSEVDFSRELDSRIGISACPYFVLIVWHPFSAYQAILSDPNGGLMMPFNVAVYQNAGVTHIVAPYQPLLATEASLGIRVLGQDLNRRMREVMLHVGTHEKKTTTEKTAPRSHGGDRDGDYENNPSVRLGSNARSDRSQ